MLRSDSPNRLARRLIVLHKSPAPSQNQQAGRANTGQILSETA